MTGFHSTREIALTTALSLTASAETSCAGRRPAETLHGSGCASRSDRDPARFGFSEGTRGGIGWSLNLETSGRSRTLRRACILLLGLLLPAQMALGAVQSKDQAECVNGVNKAVARAFKTFGKDATKCVAASGAGKVNADACVDGAVARAVATSGAAVPS